MRTSLATLWLLAALPLAAARQVAILTGGQLAPPARHGLAALEQALTGKGFAVTHAATGADYVVRAEVATPPGAPESLTIRRTTQAGKPTVILRGGDSRGLMYAALDTAARVGWSASDDPFQQVRDISEQPYLAERAISIYTMQQAYFESRLHDPHYWEKYFDMLAASRINSFVVIFGYENGGYMAPMYPYFFNVPGYRGVEVVGLTAKEQARNAASFQALIRLAHERGISVTAGIWDHIYRGGVQGGGIPGASANAGKRVPGLVFGVTAGNLSAYTKAALKRFLEVFHDIDGIQFRMHDESGLKPSEMASFWHEVFGMIKQARPDLRIDLRAKGLPDGVINDALDQGLNARVNTKYWMEQMGLPFHPTHVNTQNQKDRRHGYADLLRYPQRYRVDWQLWSGGTTRLLLWGDPEYVRRFAESARLYDGNSFEVNEMLATKMLGEPHAEKPRDILNAQYRYYEYEFERYWHFYQVWGRVGYNPRTAPEVWWHDFERHFGAYAGTHLMDALHLASQVLPRIVASAYRYQYFPTTRGWAEMNHQDDLAKFAGEEGSDIQQFLNPRDEARSILEGTDTAMRRPQENSAWFARVGSEIIAHVNEAQKGIDDPRNKEYISTVTDLKILAGLARYYSWRLRAAVAYNLYRDAGNLGSFDEAIAYERRALEAWRGIVGVAGDVYRDDLAFGAHAVGFRHHWKEELGLMEAEFARLQEERANAVQRAGAKPVPRVVRDPDPELPEVRLPAAAPAVPGQDVEVAARITSSDGVKWARLRYRHLTQYEDYQTAPMTLDERTGQYKGRIPASFIDPKWNLMYFVEVVDGEGNGRMYPDLDVEMPYVIVPVKR